MWDVLKAHQAQAPRIVDLFKDETRPEEFSISADGLYFDFAKTDITKACWEDLVGLAKEANVETWRDAMFSGEKINVTEDRAVLHTALRNLDGGPVEVDGDQRLVACHFAGEI